MSITINYDDNTMINVSSNVNVINYPDIQSSNSKVMYDGKTYSLNQIWLINNGTDAEGHVVLVNQYTDYSTSVATTYYFYIDLVNDGKTTVDPSGGLYNLLTSVYSYSANPQPSGTQSVPFAMNKYLLQATAEKEHTIRTDRNNNYMVSIPVSSATMARTSTINQKTLPDYAEKIDNIKFEVSGDRAASQLKNCKLVGTSGKKSIGSDPNYPEIKKAINITFLVVFFVGLFLTVMFHLGNKPYDTDFFGNRLVEDIRGSMSGGGGMKGGNCNFIGELSSPAPKIIDFFKTTAMLLVVVLLTYGIKSNVDFLITAVVVGVVLFLAAVLMGIDPGLSDVSFHSVLMVSPTYPAAKWTAIFAYFLAYTTFMRIIQKSNDVRDAEIITFIVNFVVLVGITWLFSTTIKNVAWWALALLLLCLGSIPVIVIAIVGKPTVSPTTPSLANKDVKQSVVQK